MNIFYRLSALIGICIIWGYPSDAQPAHGTDHGAAASGTDHGIAAFSIWQPKDEHRFGTGYKQHLQWHRRSGDKWSWYGWYVVSGPHFGQFVDATFDHSWDDFSHPVDPAGDGADNNLHTDPFGDYLTAFKLARIEEASTPSGLNAKFSRWVTVKTSDPVAIRRILVQLKDRYADSVAGIQCFRMVDGGSLQQVFILIGLTGWEQMGRTSDLAADLAGIERALKTNVITGIESELLAYKEDMSLIGQ